MCNTSFILSQDTGFLEVLCIIVSASHLFNDLALFLNPNTYFYVINPNFWGLRRKWVAFDLNCCFQVSWPLLGIFKLNIQTFVSWPYWVYFRPEHSILNFSPKWGSFANSFPIYVFGHEWFFWPQPEMKKVSDKWFPCDKT